MPVKPTIFISYRRQPAADLARYIHHRLTTLRYNVFLDVETINGGRFADVIQHEIKGRDVFVVILTPETLQSEWVVREIKTALENNKQIIPLAAQGFSFAHPLPEAIQELSDYDAVRWDNDFAEPAFERLVKAIDPNYRANARMTRPGIAVTAAVLIVLAIILALFVPGILKPANAPTPTPPPTTAIAFVDMPTRQQIMNLDTTATEIILQRTVDAKATAVSQSFAESTRLAQTAHAPTNTPYVPPKTTATQVIEFGATATEALLQRTVVAQGVINATLLAENTRIIETSTLTATLSPVPSWTPTSRPSATPSPTVTTIPTSLPSETYTPLAQLNITPDTSQQSVTNLSFPTVNLIQNPGAEMELKNTGITGWTEGVGTSWTHRRTTDGNAPYQGNFYFFAGASSRAELYQDIDVSIWSDMIDTSQLSFHFEGYLHSADQSPPDRARIVLEFRNSNSLVLNYFDTGWTKHVSNWQLISRTETAPLGTRTIRVRLIAMRYSGENNDGYFDELSLVANLLP